jgi:acyl-CoA synthetase (AMP-forming)/AMP-acid ligase II
MISEISRARSGPLAAGEGMLSSEILDLAVERRPSGPAVFCGGLSFSYPEVHDRVRRLAAVFSGLGAARGDRLAVLHRNCHRFYECYFAALRIGAVLVPVNPRLSAGEIRSILEDSEAILAVAEPGLFMSLVPVVKRLPRLKRVLWTGPIPPFDDPRYSDFEEALCVPGGGLPPAASEDETSPAHIYYTSGSSGAPKGVILTRRNLAAHAEKVLPELDIGRDTGWAHIAPMFHLADAWAVWAVTAAGGTHSFLSDFSVAGALALLESERVTMTNMVPTMYSRLVREAGLTERSFPGLRLLLSGGAPMSADTALRVLTAFRCEYAQTYGLTETSPFLTLSRPRGSETGWSEAERIRLRCTTGRPLRGVEVRVVGEDGAEVPWDGRSVGEIQARGETVSPGYWRRPEETAAAFQGGWLKTGDLAVVGPEGYLTIVDRKKDMIITGGEKVYSLEVENALATHPEVLESAVFGIPDDDLGEAVAAAVVLKGTGAVAPRDLISHCAERLSRYKVPRTVRIVKELPKTGTGKILKRALREEHIRLR